MHINLKYEFVKPDQFLDDFVESFWLLQNLSDSDKEVVILPDGRIDLFFTKSATEPFQILLLGIENQVEETIIAPKRQTFAISKFHSSAGGEI